MTQTKRAKKGKGHNSKEDYTEKSLYSLTKTFYLYYVLLLQLLQSRVHAVAFLDLGKQHRPLGVETVDFLSKVRQLLLKLGRLGVPESGQLNTIPDMVHYKF